MNEPPSVIFGHILANKETLGIQDFSVKHTTLDEARRFNFRYTFLLKWSLFQVFVNMANGDKSSEFIAAKMTEERRPPSGASQNTTNVSA